MQSMPSHLERLAAFITRAEAKRLVFAAGLSISLILAAAVVWLLVELRQEDIADAGSKIGDLALILAEETDRSFQAAALVQAGLIENIRQQGIDSADDFERDLGSLAVHRNLQDRIAGLPHIAALSLVDRHGVLLNFSRSWPSPRTNDADRDFIQRLLEPGAPKSIISEPQRSKSSGRMTIYLSRRLNASDGRLIGIVVTTMEAGHFEWLFSTIAAKEFVAFALYRRDGTLLAGYPHEGAANPTHDLGGVATSLGDGSARPAVGTDGRERLIAARGLAQYPLLITASQSMKSILKPWRVELHVLGGTAILLGLLIAGIVLLGRRYVHNRELLVSANLARLRAEGAEAMAQSELVLARQREASERETHRQSARFETALGNMLQGLVMVDHAGQVLVVNRRFCELAGLPTSAARPGMSYAELTSLTVSIGNLREEDLNEIRRRREEVLGRNRRARFIWELSDGRAFAVTHQPTEEGWLATYEDITEHRAQEARITHLASHDSLTDLPNRRLLNAMLEGLLVRRQRRQLLALHFLDLDHFKAVNDTLGHPIGDRLLVTVARRLSGVLRETDIVARLGGDEFAIVQCNVASPVDATELARRLIEAIAAPVEIDGHRIIIGTSVGIAFAPEDALDPDQLLKCADLALYRAKTDGRGVCRLFHKEMDAAMQARRVLELDLRHALHAGEFELQYQPVISLRERRIAGFEALLRWPHPTRGSVPPGQFMPLAEETGMIVPIGEWVLGQACAAATEWPDDVTVAVNLSAMQFRGQNLVATVAAALQRSGLSPRRLELEVTETVMLYDTEENLAVLRQLHELGISIAMDDFGTGYSSLSYLRRFPFDRIKIDQSFVRGLGKQADCGAIVRAVTALGADLGMHITAEGVETRQQLEALQRAGCTDIQGYLFSPAVPGDEVAELLRRMPAGAGAFSAIGSAADERELAGPVAAP
jgi:diguanylate cyclase (GGDEF)-like protein/PAS domain S-box-containing protein